MADWSAAQYLKFEDERTRPARDLVAQIPVEIPRRVVDIGCGPGNSTELLVERWPDARVSGFDTSPDMIEKARARLPGVNFALADAATWQPAEPVDVIFANAVFQWLPEHPAVLARLMGCLAPGGALAVQMPDNLGEPSHRLMRETAPDMPFAEKLGRRGAGAAAAGVLLLRSAVAARRPARHLAHGLQSSAGRCRRDRRMGEVDRAEAVSSIRWTRPRRGLFLENYTARIAKAYPPTANGKVLLRFPAPVHCRPATQALGVASGIKLA